jgi:hypothetical protein
MMPRTTTTVGYTATNGLGRRRTIAWTVLVMLALVLIGGAFVLGRVTCASDDSASSSAGMTMRAGVPVPNRHSVAGAATAAADFQIAGFRVAAGSLSASTAASVLLSAQASSAAEQVLAAPTASTAQLAQSRTSYAPLSLVVRSYTASRAVVQVWGVAASSSRTTPQPAGTEDWGSSVISLTWDGSQWRVADQQFSDGPWPARADQHPATTTGDFSFRFDEVTNGWTYVPEP